MTAKTKPFRRSTSTKAALKSPRVPSLRHHKASGQGYVVLNGRAIYLGRFAEPETTQKYHQVIAEWTANGRQMATNPDEITIKETIARFWAHAESYYVKPDGRPTSELGNFKEALKFLKHFYGDTAARRFGPKALRVVRQRMIEAGWCRTNINRMIGRIRRLFRWATEQELIHGDVYHALQAVCPLKRGRCDARESKPVRPVPQEHVDAIEPFVSRQVWAMVQLQLLTAARAGEVAIMRPCDIDRSSPVWAYRLADHKTAHHGHERIVYIGPRSQAVLATFLLRSHDAYCFSPAEALAEHYADRHTGRTTPLNHGNSPGTNRLADPVRTPGDHYTVAAYRRAITRAIKQAFRPKAMTAAEFRTWKPPQHWHPHQLRHNAATHLRKEFGLETARIILGHRSSAITEVYAELDQKKAIEAMTRVG